MNLFTENEKEEFTPAEILLGRKIRRLRTSRGYSLRTLADLSGLNVNTLSLIENGKISASVSTLQQLSLALGLPISAFFETEKEKRQIVFTQKSGRPLVKVGNTHMFNLAQDLAADNIQPLILHLDPGQGSGEQMTIHSGWEFVYCLQGELSYRIDRESYELSEGDSLVFDAHLPHCWENPADIAAEVLLIFLPSDHAESAGGRHFWFTNRNKENVMKIAVITDDGKTVSKHFGRARFYQVLTVEDSKIVESEMRPKLGHTQFGEHQQGEEHHHGEHHGSDGESHSRHQSMAEAISDCQVVICGGMGMGAYESMRRLNIKPLVTDLSDIEIVAQAFIDGTLTDHPEMLH